MTDRELMQQALDALREVNYEQTFVKLINVLRERLAHCDRCGKKLGGDGDIHTCTPDPIGDAQDRLIAELAAQPAPVQKPVAVPSFIRQRLEREIGFDRAELWLKRINEAVLAEREACLNCYSPDDTAQDWADKIKARSDK